MTDIKSTNLKSTATVYPENIEFTTSFSVKFTKDANPKPIDTRALEWDIVGTFADVIIRALETRMSSCLNMLMRNSNRIIFANEYLIQFKKNNGHLHVFNRTSFDVMRTTIEALKEGRITCILNSIQACDQIAKALYWVPEEDRKERNGIGFGRLVSVIINIISRQTVEFEKC